MAIQELSREEVSAVSGGANLVGGLVTGVLGLASKVLGLPLVANVLGVVTKLLGRL
jgi:hypothetical protein